MKKTYSKLCVHQKRTNSNSITKKTTSTTTLCIHQKKNKFKALHSPKKTTTERNETTRHDTRRHHTGRHDTTLDETTKKKERKKERKKEKKKERQKIRVNPDPRTREAASLANAVALPVAVHKTPTPIH